MMVAPEENPETVALEEVRPMRDQVQALVACRIAIAMGSKPIEQVTVPEFVRQIVRIVVKQAREDYPDGLPTPPDLYPVVRSYTKRAAKLYDDAIAGQFELAPTEPERRDLE